MQSSSNQDLRVCLFRVSVVPREILPRPHFISKCRTLYRESKLFLCFIVLTLDSDDTRYSGRRDRELLETQHIRTRFVCYTAKERIIERIWKYSSSSISFSFETLEKQIILASSRNRCHQSVLLFYRFPSRCAMKIPFISHLFPRATR